MLSCIGSEVLACCYHALCAWQYCLYNSADGPHVAVYISVLNMRPNSVRQTCDCVTFVSPELCFVLCAICAYLCVFMYVYVCLRFARRPSRLPDGFYASPRIRPAQHLRQSQVPPAQVLPLGSL